MKEMFITWKDSVNVQIFECTANKGVGITFDQNLKFSNNI